MMILQRDFVLLCRDVLSIVHGILEFQPFVLMDYGAAIKFQLQYKTYCNSNNP